ncbi:hypothetical protein IW261DRAFT_817881 [Armillaria novae-zelandiae]|uniref:Uncharacterized protein n=1 Tax=Armillaria novae-zelandiae TaxID=153914 RepID=A0AA39NV24_9AGAR|nr:hypothetical protein IW261DRAFT_817881 [Armillaria novae-zelandiae]
MHRASLPAIQMALTTLAITCQQNLRENSVLHPKHRNEMNLCVLSADVSLLSEYCRRPRHTHPSSYAFEGFNDFKLSPSMTPAVDRATGTLYIVVITVLTGLATWH